MEKKTCCGCFGIGCLLLIALVVVGGYFSFNFLHESGKEFAAEGFEKSVEKIAEAAFNETDREEITRQAAAIAEEIRSGRIGLINLLTSSTQKLEKNLHVKSLLLAFYRQNKIAAEAGEGLPVDEDGGADVVERLIYGLTENRIAPDQIASITALIIERYSETTGGSDGKVKHTVSLQRLRTGLTQEELRKSLQMMREVVDLNAIETPADDYDATTAVKNDFVRFFSGLREAAEKDEK